MEVQQWQVNCTNSVSALYGCSCIVIKWRRMRWAGRVARIGGKTNKHRVLVERRQGKKRLGIPKHRWNGVNK